ncbi:MAG TPA: fluoride efflux transporter CrcB [Blastocatellia bacterium]|nr:fluoride efflux transporter CrcB [Blastocatellia bacterium]
MFILRIRPADMDVAKVLLVLLGGALGTGCRYWLSTFVYSVIEKPSFPYANLIINVSGSFIIGVLAELFETRLLVSPTVRAALLTGVLGGYTTFSSFSFETFSLLRHGEMWLALVNAFGSVLLGMVAVWMGVRLAQLF